MNIPLVLHGASGIPKEQIIKAIQLGHRKINMNTELNEAWLKAVKEAFENEPKLTEIKLLLTPGTEAITRLVKDKIKEFGFKS
ncbi:6-phospho-5-dehydro-2-deoxy-D-gluconate aldolase [compost metagenome]